MRNANGHLPLKPFPVVQSHRFGCESPGVAFDRLGKQSDLTLQPFTVCHHFLACGAFLHNAG
jgi:hypothetical protein